MALTSVGAYAVGTRGLALRRSKLAPAVMEMLECLGLMVAFVLGNLAVGVMLIVGFRALTRQFVSVYWLNDISLVVLSLVQALIFHCWRRGAK